MNTIINGNSLDVLKTFEDNSIDSIVTDPPYELGFMGKAWDSTGIANNVELWQECLRVLKPGGHLLAFSGTRTYHRMACAIEDAGFEIRDQIQWLYGSGFPKSLNIGKSVDKLQGNEREDVGESKRHGGGIVGNGSSYELPPTTPNITKGTSEWEGWGTALKPANEPICMARKPLGYWETKNTLTVKEKDEFQDLWDKMEAGMPYDEKRYEELLAKKEVKVFKSLSVAENCLKYGTGGINIDESRVGKREKEQFTGKKEGSINAYGDYFYEKSEIPLPSGRFPANLIHDGSDEVVDLFPEDSQMFFYCAKTSKSERNKGLEGFTNTHPTIKPIKLMSYLCRLITPKCGTVLDPFNGSGSTGCACVLEGFNYIGIDLDPEYCKISEARIKAYEEEVKQEKLIQLKNYK